MNINRKYNRRSKSKSQPTLRQLECREKMAMAVHFLNPLRVLLDTAYSISSQSKRPQGYHGAVSHLISYALRGDYPNLAIDFSRVVLSKGRLMRAYAAQASIDGDLLTVNWFYAEAPYAWSDDEAVVVLYNEEKDIFLVLRRKAERQNAGLRVSLPTEFVGCTVHAYLFFLSRTGKDSSLSVYLKPVLQDGAAVPAPDAVGVGIQRELTDCLTNQ